MKENVSAFFTGEILKITFYHTSLPLHLKRQARHLGRSQSFPKRPKLGAHSLHSPAATALPRAI